MKPEMAIAKFKRFQEAIKDGYDIVDCPNCNSENKIPMEISCKCGECGHMIKSNRGKDLANWIGGICKKCGDVPKLKGPPTGPFSYVCKCGRETKGVCYPSRAWKEWEQINK